MKRKEGFLLRQFGDDYIVVAVGDDAENFNKLITLNGVGAFIYNFIVEEKSRDEVVAALTEHYEVERSLAESDVAAFEARLSAAGLIDD